MEFRSTGVETHTGAYQQTTALALFVPVASSWIDYLKQGRYDRVPGLRPGEDRVSRRGRLVVGAAARNRGVPLPHPLQHAPGTDGLEVITEVEGLTWASRLCIYRNNEQDSACPRRVGAGVEILEIPGDPHLENDSPGIFEKVHAQRDKGSPKAGRCLSSSPSPWSAAEPNHELERGDSRLPVPSPA